MQDFLLRIRENLLTYYVICVIIKTVKVNKT